MLQIAALRLRVVVVVVGTDLQPRVPHVKTEQSHLVLEVVAVFRFYPD